MSSISTKNNFDLIRLFAATQVAIVHAIHHFDFHSWTTLFQALRIFPGVPIFFVISGFLISASYERNPNNVRYFKSRALRIFPGLWVCLLFSILVSWYFIRFDLLSLDFFLWFVSQSTIVQFYNPNIFDEFGVGVLNGSLWTIPVELQFYILLPVFYMAAARIKNSSKYLLPAIVILALAQIVDVMVLPNMGLGVAAKLFHVSIVPHLYLFLIGMLIQKNKDVFLEMFRGKLLFLFAIYLILWLLGSGLGVPVIGNAINPVSASLLAVIVILVAYTGVPNQSLLRGCDISYGVYIYHMVFINLFIELGFAESVPGMLIALFATMVAAYLSWMLVRNKRLSLGPGNKLMFVFVDFDRCECLKI